MAAPYPCFLEKMVAIAGREVENPLYYIYLSAMYL